MTAKIECAEDFMNGLCDLAIKQGLPPWAAECLGFSESHIEKIKNARDVKKEKKYLCWLFPKLKHKINYRYEIKSDRSLFKNRLRTLLRTNLQYNNISARTLTESMIEFLLGYSISELMRHLESMFTAEMTWENHGKVWQIDHIYPCSKLKYNSVHDNNFKKLWQISNLRPLCKIENNKKSDKVIKSGENG